MPDERKNTPAGEAMKPVQYTVAPGRYTQITMRTYPHAVCKLRREDEAEPRHFAYIYADEEGLIRMQVRPSNEHEQVAHMVIECEADGKVTHFPLHLRPHSSPTQQMPAPPPHNPKPVRREAKIRPAITVEEALRLPDEELLQRGYPLPPDPEGTPVAFNSWRRVVSAPFTMIEPRLVPRPDLSHGTRVVRATGFGSRPTAGTESSGNWSGFELRGAAGTYDWVTAIWHVPTVTGESNAHTYSAYWIGLDGDGVTDLVQAGTEQENIDFDFLFFHLSFSFYYAWTEFLPQQPTEQQISNFPVNPGDEIFCEVYIANAGGSPSLSGFFGQFVIQNLTTSEYTWIYTPVGATSLSGSEAVWIMERPSLGSSLTDLADYGSTVMSSAYARRTNSARHQGYVPYQGANNLQITMSNGGDTLSTVTPIDAYSMRFNWQAFH